MVERLPVKEKVGGSNPPTGALEFLYQWVAGSNPAAGAQLDK